MSYRAPLIALGVLVVLGVAYWFLLYQPLLEEQEDLEAETARLETEASGLRTEIAELRRVEEEQVEYRAELALMEEYVPPGVDQPTSLRQFQDTADAAGVDILNLSFGQPVAVEDAPPTGEPDTVLADVTFSMTVEGGYFQVVDLFRRFEVDVPRAMLVETIALNESEVGFPTLSVNWTGRVFAVVDVADTALEEDAEPIDPDAEPVDPDAEPVDPDAEPVDPDADDDTEDNGDEALELDEEESQ